MAKTKDPASPLFKAYDGYCRWTKSYIMWYKFWSCIWWGRDSECWHQRHYKLQWGMLCNVRFKIRYAYMDWHLSCCSSKKGRLSGQHPIYFITLPPMVARTWVEIYSLCHPSLTVKLLSPRCVCVFCHIYCKCLPHSSITTCMTWPVHIFYVHSYVSVCAVLVISMTLPYCAQIGLCLGLPQISGFTDTQFFNTVCCFPFLLHVLDSEVGASVKGIFDSLISRLMLSNVRMWFVSACLEDAICANLQIASFGQDPTV